MDFNELLTQWSALAGMAALIAVIINLLKLTGLVKDGDAQTWSAALNLLGLAALFVLRVIRPDVDPGRVDEQLGALAKIAMLIIAYISQLLTSKATHLAVKHIPLIGTSLPGCASGEPEQYRGQMSRPGGRQPAG